MAAPLSAAEFHVSPAGAATGDGSGERPWSLAAALAGPESVKPGDTIWLHAGTYRGGVVARLMGQPDRPIVVRGRPGERVILDTHPRDERDNGLLAIRGADTVYRDFEITCSHPARVTGIPGSWPADIRRGSVDVRGDRIGLVNLVVHDCAQGFGFWSEGEGGEISGCLIYNNGWQGPDRGHGHGVYAQNERGVKRIVDNVLFHQFAYGIHAYGSEKASLKGFEIAGNIVFENGCLSRGGNSSGILVGGGCPAARVNIRDNVVVGGNIRLGYPWGGANEDATVTGNYCHGGLVLRDFRKATVARNIFVAPSTVVSLEGARGLMRDGLKWDENQYYITDGRWGDTSVVEHGKSRGLTFEQWRQTIQGDARSTFTKGAPTQQRVIVRPNAHERGRAHVAIINPQAHPEVEVDLSGVLSSGQRFRIVSVKDVFGKPLVSGAYVNRPVRVPMTPVTPPPPVGLPDVKLPVTEPAFAAFVVLPEPAEPTGG